MSGLEVAGLRAGYGAARVLHGVDLVAGEREIVVVLGPNGAGKTTLLRALSGLVAARGAVRVGGVPVLGLAPEEIARRGLGHVTEERGVFAPLTVEENLRAGAFARPWPRRGVDDDLARVFTYFPVLQAHLRQPAGTLSGGEQGMLAIGRALMGRPRVLLLDEPSRGLSPGLTARLFQTLAAIAGREGGTMVVAEQNARAATQVAHRVRTLDAGRLVA